MHPVAPVDPHAPAQRAGGVSLLPPVQPRLHDELELLVAAGLTPVQALQAATSAAADYLGRDDVGTLRAGAVADAVLLDADPLLDIRATRRIHAVMLRGRWLDRAALDAMLDDARRAAE